MKTYCCNNELKVLAAVVVLQRVRTFRNTVKESSVYIQHQSNMSSSNFEYVNRHINQYMLFLYHVSVNQIKMFVNNKCQSN